jgi:hypothetical protein
VLERELPAGGGSPTLTKQLRAKRAHARVRKVERAPQVSDGFTTLWEHGRLDLSVEAHVLRPEFVGLFSAEERAIAAKRLSDYGYEAPMQ